MAVVRVRSIVGHWRLRELSHPGNGGEHVLALLSALHIACAARIQPADVRSFIALIQAVRSEGDTLPRACDFLENAAITEFGDAPLRKLAEQAVE